MQPFLINSHGRMVFPSNFLPQLDFSVIDDLDQRAAVIRRDFEAKAPTGTEILRRIEGSSTPVGDGVELPGGPIEPGSQVTVRSNWNR